MVGMRGLFVPTALTHKGLSWAVALDISYRLEPPASVHILHTNYKKIKPPQWVV